jgi:hypothetical protein
MSFLLFSLQLGNQEFKHHRRFFFMPLVLSPTGTAASFLSLQLERFIVASNQMISVLENRAWWAEDMSNLWQRQKTWHHGLERKHPIHWRGSSLINRFFHDMPWLKSTITPLAVAMGMQKASFDICHANTKCRNAEVCLTQTDSDPSRSSMVLFHIKTKHEICLAFNVRNERVLHLPAHPGLQGMAH